MPYKMLFAWIFLRENLCVDNPGLVDALSRIRTFLLIALHGALSFAWVRN